MGPFRHRLLSVSLVGVAALAPVATAAQSPAPSSSPAPAPSGTPIPERVGFEGIPNHPGTGTEPGGLPWVQVAPRLPDGHHLWSVMTWARGFAAIEWRLDRRSGNQAVAVWRSPDGATWSRSPLPRAATNAWLLLAQGSDLVLGVLPGDNTDSAVHVELWRSSDAIDWRRSGDFAFELPARDRAEWEVHWHDLLVVRDRLVLLTATRHRDNGAGGWAPMGSQLAMAGATQPEHMTAWISRTGERWAGREVTGVTTSFGTVSLGVQGVGPDGPLGIVEGRDARLVTSTNGRTWTRLAGMPADWTSLGSFGMVWSDGGPLVVADSDKTEGGAGCGNRIGGWRLDQGATEWTEVFDRQAGVVHGLAAAGSLVIVTGRGWCTAADWGWTLVSTDGGRTWDPDLSWTGAQFTCVADVAIAAGVAVMLGCPEDGHPIWRSVLPDVAATPHGSPEPSPAD